QDNPIGIESPERDRAGSRLHKPGVLVAAPEITECAPGHCAGSWNNTDTDSRHGQLGSSAWAVARPGAVTMSVACTPFVCGVGRMARWRPRRRWVPLPRRWGRPLATSGGSAHTVMLEVAQQDSWFD